MAYSPTTWVEGTTPLGPTNLNHLEAGVVTADANATAAGVTAAAAVTTANAAIPKSLVTTAGDIIYATGAGALARLPVGAAGQFLGVAGGLPAFQTPAGAGTELGYTEFTSNVSVSATSEATANTVVTSASITFDGAAVIVEFYSPDAINGSSSTLKIILRDDTGTTVLGQIGQVLVSGATQNTNPVLVRRRFTPAAGSRVYSIRAWTTSAAGQIGAGAGGAATDMPGYIRFTKV